jgi:hypothetical protein
MPYGLQITRKDNTILGTTVAGSLPAIGTVVDVKVSEKIITVRITRHPAKPGLPAMAEEIETGGSSMRH